MKLFNRDNENEFEEDEISTKKFKDLKPENKKKRKEPVKPWGKKERYLILVVLLVTIGTSTALALSARDFKLPGLPKLELSLPPFKSETIVIESKKNNLATQEEAKSEFKEKTRNLSGTYALYVVRLKDGAAYGINENKIIEAASLIKLPVLTTLYKEAENENISLDTKYTLKNSDKRTGSGSLSGKPAGTILTYRELAGLMGKQSDNTAFNVVRSVLGDAKIQGEIERIGMVDTSLKENKTTAYDIGVFFEKLWNGEIVSEESRDEILKFLTDTIYENWIAAGVPEGIRVAHKYGREVHVVNDAGIVFSKRPFVLVIMTDGVVEKEADSIIPEIVRDIYRIETD